MERECRFAIYSRKSRFTGKGESIENQVEMCRQYIEMHHGKEAAESAVVFEDEGFSGGNLERPQFKRMMKAIHNREIGGMVVYRLDRISRNVSNFSALIAEMTSLNVKFISIKEQFDTETSMGRAMMYICSVFSQLERETIAERIRDNMHELAKTGRWLGGMTPTGYASKSVEQISVDGKQKKACMLDAVPSELAVVQLIFDKFLETKSLTQTEAFLLQNHYTSKQKKNYTRFSIKSILTNPVYMKADQAAYQYLQVNQADLHGMPSDFDGIHGIMAYNRSTQIPGKTHILNPMNEWIVAVGKHEGLISGAYWVEAQGLLNQNKDKSYRKPKSNVALLSGLLRCGHCGSYMRPKLTNRNNSNGDRIYTYMCEMKEKSKRSRCNIKNCNGNHVDATILDEMKQLSENHGDFIKGLEQQGFADNSETYQDALKKLEQEQAGKAQEIKRLISIMATSDNQAVVDHVSKEIGVMDVQLKEITRHIDELNSLQKQQWMLDDQFAVLSQLLSTFGATIDQMTVAEQCAALRTVIKQVVWDGENIHLILFGSQDDYDYPIQGESVPQGEDSK